MSEDVIRADDIDFELQNEGSLVLIRPRNANAELFLRNRVDPTNSTWWAGALIVESDFVGVFVEILLEAGYTVFTPNPNPLPERGY